MRKMRNFVLWLLMACMLFSMACTAAPASDQAETAIESDGAVKVAPHKDVITFAMCGSDDSYNPYNHNSNYGDIVFDMICDHLVYVAYDGSFEPRLAETWEINEECTEMVFHLNHDVVWHDGEPFTANDVVFTCKIVTHPDVVSNRRTYFSCLAGTDASGIAEIPYEIGVEALDDYTVKVLFKNPVDPSAFLSGDNRKWYIIPEHLLKDVEPSVFHQSEFWQHPIGTGAFMFESMVPGDRIELVANKDYFLGAPNFDKLVMRTVTASNLVPGLMSGELDILAGMGLANIPLEDWELAQEIEGVNAVSLPNYGYQIMSVNWRRDYLQDSRVRLAISKAINRQAIVDQLAEGQGSIMYGPLVPSHPYFNDAIANDPYDPEGARALLEEAGWDFDRELLLMVPTGNKVREYSGAMIQNDLQAVGLKVQIQYSDLTSIIALEREDGCDLALIGSSGSVDPDESRGHYEINGGQNWGGITDPKFYELAAAGKALTNFEERKVVYDEYQKVISEECPIIYLYTTNSLVAARAFFDYVPMIDFALQNHKVYAWTFKD